MKILEKFKLLPFDVKAAIAFLSTFLLGAFILMPVVSFIIAIWLGVWWSCYKIFCYFGEPK